MPLTSAIIKNPGRKSGIYITHMQCMSIYRILFSDVRLDGC